MEQLTSLTLWVTTPEEKDLWKLSHCQLVIISHYYVIISHNLLPRTSYMAPPNSQRNRKYNLFISLERRKIRNIWQRDLITGMPIPNLTTYHLGILFSLKERECFFSRVKRRLEIAALVLNENDRICLCQVMERVTERKLRIHIRLYIYYFYS